MSSHYTQKRISFYEFDLLNKIVILWEIIFFKVRCFKYVFVPSGSHICNFSLSQISNQTNGLDLIFFVSKSSTVFFFTYVFAWCNSFISTVSEVIYLGIIYSKLVWNHHFNTLITRISFSLNSFQCVPSTKLGGDPSILTLLYIMIIHSKLDYESILYNSASRTYIAKLERLQNRCINSTSYY